MLAYDGWMAEEKGDELQKEFCISQFKIKKIKIKLTIRVFREKREAYY